MQLELIETAKWTSSYRYLESQKKSPLFSDPIALDLISFSDIEKFQSLRFNKGLSWAFLARTLIIDKIIEDLVATKQIDTVINLGSGYDARAWRLNLTSELNWIDVDHNDIGLYKMDFLKRQKTKCHWEFYAVDYQLEKGFQSLRTLLCQSSNNKVLLLTEGLIYYLNAEQLAAFYKILSDSNLHFWVSDYINGMLKICLNGLAYGQRPLFQSSIDPRKIKIRSFGLVKNNSLFEFAFENKILTPPMALLYKYLNLYPKFIGDYYRNQSGVCYFKKSKESVL